MKVQVLGLERQAAAKTLLDKIKIIKRQWEEECRYLRVGVICAVSGAGPWATKGVEKEPTLGKGKNMQRYSDAALWLAKGPEKESTLGEGNVRRYSF